MGSFCCSLTSVWFNFKAICFGHAPCAGFLWWRVFKGKNENEINVSPSWLLTRLYEKRVTQMARQNKWLFLVWIAGSWEMRGATRPNDQWQPWESLEMKTYGFSLLKTCLKFIDARSLTQLPHLANRQASNNPTSCSRLNKFPFITRTKPERLKQNRQVILVTEKLDEGFFQMIRRVMRMSLCSESSVAGSRYVSGPGPSWADHIWQCAFPV